MNAACFLLFARFTLSHCSQRGEISMKKVIMVLHLIFIIQMLCNGKIIDRKLIRHSRKGNYSKVVMLLEKGADINFRNGKGKTALIEAAQKGHFFVVKYLLQQGADVSILDNEFKTALVYSADNGRTDLVQLFQETGLYNK